MHHQTLVEQARFEASCGNVEEARKLFQQALEFSASLLKAKAAVAATTTITPTPTRT
jgi:hypothetical protein